MHMIRVHAAETAERLVCLIKGHRWDSDRPSGPIHQRDICWRCPAVRDHATRAGEA